MRKSVIVLCAIIVLLTAGLTQAQQKQVDDVISQWAISASASSEYSSGDYSAQQATGPATATGCESSTASWTPAAAGGVETLTVYFNEPVQPSQINVFVNYDPGTITSLALLTIDNTRLTIPNSAMTDDSCPGIHTVNLAPSLVQDVYATGLEIELNQRTGTKWTEIDAVEIIGASLNGLSQADIDSIVVVPDQRPVFEGPLGETINCNGSVISENGVAVTVVQMRPNSNYTATVVGLNGFDPVLSVRDAATGQGLCNDDERSASYYAANLPTTGLVSASNTTASLPFNTFNYSDLANIELVVGGLNSQPGEFLLILEGMLLSTADGAGDPLSLKINPAMVLSGINPTVYMISVVAALDPLIALIDGDYNFMSDTDGAVIACDDAGTNSCWGDSSTLRGASVSRTQNRTLGGANTDAMLTLPISSDNIGLFFNTIMRSFEMRSFGDYVVVYHIGLGE